MNKIDMQMWLSVKIYCLDFFCGILNLHLWVSVIVLALAFGIWHSQLGLCVLILLVLTFILLDLDIIIPFSLALGLVQSWYTNMWSNQNLRYNDLFHFCMCSSFSLNSYIQCVSGYLIWFVSFFDLQQECSLKTAMSENMSLNSLQMVSFSF